MKYKMVKSVLTQLKVHNVNEKDILIFSPIDLSFDGEYIKGYIFLTNDRVGVCTIAPPDNYVYCFKGVKVGEDLPIEEKGDYTIEFYDIKALQHIRLDQYIGTNEITADYNGVPRRIAAFTNRYLEEMNVFVRQLRNYIKGEKISVEESDEEEEQEDETSGKSKRSIFGRTLKYFLKYRIQVIILMLTYGISAVIGIAWPYLIGKVLFDHVLERDDVYLARFGMEGKYVLALLAVALVMLGCRLINQISNYLQIFVMSKVASSAVKDIKTDVFDAMSRLSLDFFINKQTGGLMTRVLSDSERVRDFFIDGLPMIFVHGITIIVTFIVMYRLNWQMALIACILAIAHPLNSAFIQQFPQNIHRFSQGKT